MIKFFKNIFKFIFSEKIYKNKYEDMENRVRNVLENDFITYTLTKNVDLLADLMKLVKFCEHSGINGKTTETQIKIKTEWESHIKGI